eukprot:11506514-Alexandrium_andersonii.AAC.1
MAVSRSSGPSKSQLAPTGPGQGTNAPAGAAPSIGRRSAIAVAQGWEKTSAAGVWTSPGDAPVAKSER